MKNDMITIENTEMQIREYAGQRVVTLKDIDAVHNKKSDTAKKSFQKHKKHFILGTDYFEMTRKEFGERYSPNEKVVGNPNIKTYLFTESGYLMIVKVFNDDIAWNVQRQLVNAYFRIKEQKELEPIQDDQMLIDDFGGFTPKVPMVSDWYERNKGRMYRMCKECDKTWKYMYHCILERVGEKYDLQKANEIYKNEVGHYPIYPIDVIRYFPELAKEADKFLDRLEKHIYGM